MYHLFTGRREEHPGAVPSSPCIGLVDTLRSVVENVLGLHELAGHDVVETPVLGSCGEA